MIWFLLLMFFTSLVGALFSVTTLTDQDFPLWLLIGRIVVLTGLLASLLGVLGGKIWGIRGLFSSAVALIPLSVTYSYFTLFLSDGLALSLEWAVRNTLITAVVVMGMVTLVMWAAPKNPAGAE